VGLAAGVAGDLEGKGSGKKGGKQRGSNGISWGCSPTVGAWRGGRNPAGGRARGGRWLGLKGGGAPAFLWRRKAVEYVRLGVAVLLMTTAYSGRTPSRRIGGGARRQRAARRRHPAATQSRTRRGAAEAARGARARGMAGTLVSRPGTPWPWHWAQMGSGGPGWPERLRSGSSLRAQPKRIG
jgi:hypothetical protein